MDLSGLKKGVSLHLDDITLPKGVTAVTHGKKNPVLVSVVMIGGGEPTAEGSGTVTRMSLEKAVESFEKEMILDALKTTRGNRARAARMLDTTERILGYKVQKYEVDSRRFK